MMLCRFVSLVQDVSLASLSPVYPINLHVIQSLARSRGLLPSDYCKLSPPGD